jgi:glycosyltransferase involved in cell wall biosynthesis
VAPSFKEHLVRHWQVSPHKISVVENGVETDIFRPAVESNLRAELRAEEKIIVAYIGTIGLAHGLETLVDAATRLQNCAPEVLFLLVGEGAERPRIASLVHSRGLKNVRFVDQQVRENIPGYICLADVCVVLLKQDDIFKTVIPTKMLEFMSCARPVILGVDGQAEKILKEAQAGICIEPENATDLVRAILRLAEDAQLRKFLGCNGRRHILQHFSRRDTAVTYLDVLNGLLGKEKRRAVAA